MFGLFKRRRCGTCGCQWRNGLFTRKPCHNCASRSIQESQLKRSVSRTRSSASSYRSSGSDHTAHYMGGYDSGDSCGGGWGDSGGGDCGSGGGCD